MAGRSTTSRLGGDYIVTNTGEGSGTVITLSLAKTFDTDYGFWNFNVGYANQDVDELRSYNRFIGISNRTRSTGRRISTTDRSVRQSTRSSTGLQRT